MQRRRHEAVKLGLGGLGVGVLFLLEVFFTANGKFWEVTAVLIGLTLQIILIGMARRGYVTLSAIGMIATLMLTIVATMIVTGTIHLGIFVLCLSILLASVMLSPRSVGITAVVCCGIIFLLWLFLPSAPRTPTTIDILRVGALLCLSCGLIGMIGSRNTERALQAAHQAKMQAETAMHALDQTNQQLAHCVTERTEELARNQALLHGLIDNSPALIFVKDVNQRFLLVNQSYATVIGREEGEIIGQTEADLFPTEIATSRQQANRQVLSTGAPCQLEDTLATADGLRTYATNLFPIYDAQQAPIAIGGIATDVTDRKRTEEDLRRSSERLRILYEIDQAILAAQSPEAIAQAALQRLYPLMACRGMSVATFDFATQEGWPLAVLFDGELGTPTMQRFSLGVYRESVEMMQRGEVYITEDLQTLDFPEALLQRFAAMNIRVHIMMPLSCEGQAVGTLNFGVEKLADMTDDHMAMAREVAASLAVAIRQARLYEQTLRDTRTKTALFREVNHRVKNNLTAIIGLLYAEQFRASQTEQAIYQKIIDEMVSRVQSLATVHSLLSESAWQPLRVSVLIEQIIHLVVQSLPSDVVATVQVAATPFVVTSDQAHNLALVINELTTNSVKYALPATGEVLQISVEITQDDTTMQIEFRDNGPGFPAEVLAGNQEYMRVGFDLVRNIISWNLRGEVSLHNNNGAVVVLQLAVTQPLEQSPTLLRH